MVEPQSPSPSSRPKNQPSQSAGKGQGSKDERSAARFKRRGARYKARRRAVDILFEAEFRDIDPVAAKKLVKRAAVLDGRNCLPADQWRAAGWDVTCLGRG